MTKEQLTSDFHVEPIADGLHDDFERTVTHEPLARERSNVHVSPRIGLSPAIVALAILGGVVPSSLVRDAHAQESSEPTNGTRSIPPATDGNRTLVVRVQVTQPYIDKVATRVTYDGLDRVFGIEWKHGKARGTLRVPDAAVSEDKVVSDIYDDTNAGVSVPARYTPITAPRLYPHLIAVRAKWGQQFDDMVHASAQIATISLVTTLRPTTSPLTARAAATPRPSPDTSKAAFPRATAVKGKPSGKATPKVSPPAKPSGVWSLPIFKRGRAIEKALGSNLVDNFPVIDRWKNGIATSIKSLDVGAKSYQNVSRLTSKVRGYINKVAKFNGQRWAGREIQVTDVKGRALMLAVPHTGTPAQQAALAKLLEYGRKLGVHVTIIVIP